MGIPIPKPASDTGIKTKLNARMPIRQGADLFEANIPANKISLPLRKANFLYIRDLVIWASPVTLTLTQIAK